jgi:hypothetical protein
MSELSKYEGLALVQYEDLFSFSRPSYATASAAMPISGLSHVWGFSFSLVWGASFYLVYFYANASAL